MPRAVAVVATCAAAATLVAACDKAAYDTPPSAARALISKGGLQQLADSNATFVGYLNDQEQPYIYAQFRDGWLQWSTDPDRRSLIQGRADAYSRPDMSCFGFEYKRLSTPGRAERYLVCEATEPLKVSNGLPRSQDFAFPTGALFLQYLPPKEVGYPQYYYLKIQK